MEKLHLKMPTEIGEVLTKKELKHVLGGEFSSSDGDFSSSSSCSISHTCPNGDKISCSGSYACVPLKDENGKVIGVRCDEISTAIC